MSITSRKLAACGTAFAIAAGITLATSSCRADETSLIARGKYLATMGDCEACHTAVGGKPFTGGLEMDTPFGKISTPNITPDKTTGIGDYTDQQFIRVFHAGVRRDGQYLYPVMPFPWYTKVTDEDVLAIKAYLFSLQPVHAPRKPMNISFPFNVRAGLAVWNEVFLTQGVFKPDPSKSAAVNRGAYIVQGLAHCGECHDARNLLGAGAAAKPLQGGEIDHWYAPNITSDVHTGIGRFSDQQLFAYLKTGTAPGMGVVVGPMAQTQHESLSKLTEADLKAVVAYLKSTRPAAGYQPSHLAALSNGTLPGAQTYLNYCASCHQLNGQGIPKVIPPLAGNGAVRNGGPQTVVQVLLGGVEAQGTYGPMPAMGVTMTDQQIADATNYVRAAWGNDAPASVGPGEVASLRKGTDSLLSGTLPGGCPALHPGGFAELVETPSMQSLLQGVTPGNIVQNVDAMVVKVKSAAPAMKQADIVNGLTAGYCQILRHDAALSQNERLDRLNQFSERVYTQVAHD
jgi:mono/diheme cytochrome c family protein